MTRKIGLIINPIAGMGGKVGLKGTDGTDILKKAIALGAAPESSQRAIEALRIIAPLKEEIRIVTYPGDMGENVIGRFDFEVSVIGMLSSDTTTAMDTIRAAREMQQSGVCLLLFVGGDGTARDIYNAIGGTLPALGVPAGVKMHSAVFGTTPRRAGELAVAYLRGKTAGIREAEVMDIDEQAFRNQSVSAILYGYLRIPFERRLVQNVKAGRGKEDDTTVTAISLDVISSMREDTHYIIGPGTTTRRIMELLNLPNTLLGVDVILNKKLVANDVNEMQLMEIIEGKPAGIIVSVIGGQGYLFGRGNQQISPKIIQKVGKDNIIIVATKEKIFALNGNPLLVDTGDEAVNTMLSGYLRVTTGLKEKLVYRVSY